MAKEAYFRKVEIFHHQSLGRGAYGIVYKAKCDQLLCAAKCIDPIFFGTGDPGVEKMLETFQSECQLLSALKHPNIVQYLGTHRESGMMNTVTLLMELMDSNLHSYLTKHKLEPIPFCLEINFTHDVALALDCLHANSIQHRDLSSKNILLLGEVRAKVSDFGVAKLNDPNSRYSTQTKAPGTMVYMPPEVLVDPPLLSERIDEFSLGVCMIEIMNRSFPNPKPLMQWKDETPDGSTGRHEAEKRATLEIVPELERRSVDISLVHDHLHPLLVLAKECLRRNPLDRPSSKQLCNLLSCLMTTERYQNSVKTRMMISDSSTQCTTDVVVSFDEQTEEIRKQNVELVQQVEDKRKQLDLREMQLKQQEVELERRQTENNQLTSDLHNMQSLLEAAYQENDGKKTELLQLDQTLSLLKSELTDVQQTAQHQTSLVRQLEASLAEKECLLQEMQDALILNIQGEGKRQLSSKDKSHKPLVAVPSHKASGWLGLGFCRPLPQLPLSWSSGVPAPCHPNQAFSQVVSIDNKVCVSISDPQQGNTLLFEYNLSTKSWNDLPPVDISQCSMVFVQNRLTAVGGNCDGNYSARVLGLTSYPIPKWALSYPVMHVARALPSCVYADPYLIVAGGDLLSEAISSVEILDTAKRCWQMVRHVPPHFGTFKRMYACSIENTVYFLGGYEGNSLTNRVLKCNLSGLLHPKILSPWETLSPVPRVGAVFVVFNGQLLALGGYEEQSYKSSSEIHSYNFKSGKWELVSSLCRTLARGLAAVATVNSKEVIVVVGGNFIDIGML